MTPRKTKKQDPVEAMTQVMNEIARVTETKVIKDETGKVIGDTGIPVDETRYSSDMKNVVIEGDMVDDVRERLINLSPDLLSPWETQFVKDLRAAVNVDMTPKDLSIATQILRRYCD